MYDILLWFIVFILIFKGSTILNYIFKIYINRFMWLRKRDLILINHKYGFIDDAMIRKINEAFMKVRTKEVDIIIHSGGGDIFGTMGIIDVMKSYPYKKNVFIPYYAMSGGTALSLACDEINMTKISSLGAVDPQTSIFLKGYFSSASLDYVYAVKGDKISDEFLANKFILKQYTHSIKNMLKRIRPDLNKGSLSFLTEGVVEHGFRMNPQLISSLGIPVKILDNKISSLLYDIIAKTYGVGFYQYKEPKGLYKTIFQRFMRSG